MIKISVIITIYNAEKYIKECLESVLNQTLNEIEILCVNDASNDRTSDILEEYRVKDSRIKIITNPINLNAGASRNIGLYKARGKYLIFLDADDVFDRYMLEKAYRKADACGADICIFKEDLLENNTYKLEKVPYIDTILNKLGNQISFSPKDVKDVIFNLVNGWAWDKIFRKQFIMNNKLRFQEIPTTNDAYFVHSAMARAEKISFLNEILVHHRINNKESLANRRNSSWQGCFKYLKQLRMYLIQQHLFEIYEKSFINWAVNFIYWDYSTLNATTRQKFYFSLREHALRELDLLKYKEKDFYNPFYFWFLQVIHNMKDYSEENLPVTGLDRWKYMLLKNEIKMAKVFEYIREHKYSVGVWGAGERGKIFLDQYGERGQIKKVFDSDITKSGTKINNKYTVEIFNEISGKEIDMLFVTNVKYLDDIVKKAKKVKFNVSVFDLDSYLDPYLAFPLGLEDCIL